MTHTVDNPLTNHRSLFRIREVHEQATLNTTLSEDRAYAAYALGHLDAGFFKHARFWIADGKFGSGILMHATALGRTMFVGGDPTAIDAILSLQPGPRTTYLTTCAPEHFSVVGRTHILSDVLHMTRMSVDLKSFNPFVRDVMVRRLRGNDIRTLNALYALENASPYYTAEQIELGIYFGAFEENRLVAVAGTHVIAPNSGIAVVGNVFTHPTHRGRGFATAATSNVTLKLLERGCPLVTLTVDPENIPALKAYTRLGYASVANVIEGRARRRSLVPVGAWLRRRMAQHRAGQSETTNAHWAWGRQAPECRGTHP